MNWTEGIPDVEPRSGEFVGMDIEMYQQSRPLHLHTGHFACLTVALRDKAWLVEGIGDVRETFRRMRDGLWVFHNADYDINHLSRYVDFPKRPIWDTMLVERHLFGGWFDSFGLSDLARRWLSHFMQKDTRKQFITQDYMTQEMKRYACWDALETLRIAECQQEYIEKHQIDMRSYWEVNAEAIWSFRAMKPVRLDKDIWMKTSNELNLKGIRLEEELGINVYSGGKDGQVAEFLNEHLDLKRPLRDTAADTLKKYAKDPWDEDDGGDIATKKILQARSYRKMGSSYGENFIETVGDDGYVMPGWIMDGAVTGRAACRNPAFHQVPVREFPEFRSAVRASPGNKFVHTDASSQEPRIGAQLSQDYGLIEIFRNDINIYIGVFGELTGEVIEKGTSRYDQIKAVTLGTFYRLTPSGLAKREGIPRDEAARLQSDFLDKFPRVDIWRHRMTEKGLIKGYIETPLYRRIWINVHDDQWPNQVVNYPIQSGAGEQTKLAMNYLYEECEARSLPYNVILQVHDELNLDVPEGLTEEYLEMILAAWHEAGKVITPDVPAQTDYGIGDSWGDAK